MMDRLRCVHCVVPVDVVAYDHAAAAAAGLDEGDLYHVQLFEEEAERSVAAGR